MNSKKGNKALCVLNFSGRYGGAEKRYATLFNRLMEKEADYYLIINRRLFNLFVDNTLLKPHKRILVFDDVGKNAAAHKNGNGRNVGSETGHKKSKLRLFLGGWKYFLRMLILWIRFSVFFKRKARHYHISMLYGVWQGGIWTWMWCKWLGIYFVYSVNASDKLMIYPDIRKFFDSQYWVLQHADAIDFLSPSLVGCYIKAMDNKIRGKIHVTPNSFINYTNYYPVLPKKPWVVFLGRLEPLKNPMLFIEAVNLLLNENNHREVTFYVMGAGSKMTRLQQYISDQKLGNIVFTGMHSQPWEILQQSSVFVSLQSSENYPSQSLIEAMACENGVVVTDVGNTRLLVTEQEGILVNHDYREVAAAIGKLLSDVALREALGENARRKVMAIHTLEKYVEWFDGMMKRS